MADGSGRNERLTSVGPFTYDDTVPPTLPSSFEPPDDITNAFGDFRWWIGWNGKGRSEYGATMLYDVTEDRMFIANRLSGPEGQDNYLHDDMVVDMIEAGPFPRFPTPVIPGEGGFASSGGRLQGSVEIPTPAGGAFVTTERLPEDKEIIESGERVSVEQFYKFIYTLALIDFPGDAIVQAKHTLGPAAGERYEAVRRFELSAAYRELSFDGLLPDPNVSPTDT